jgi:adenosylmethionine-8-amino-7-oxononanoate aminotransferase
MSDWLTRDQRAVLHSQHLSDQVQQAIVWESGHGPWLVDIHGQRYFDALSGLWNVLVGHSRAELVSAAQAQLQQLAFVSSFSGATHPRAIELAELIQSVTNLPEWRFFFTSGGGEALEAAIKTARYYWQHRGKPQKHQFLCYDRAYHGTTLAMLSATGFAAYQTPFVPTVPGMHHVPTPGTQPEWSTGQYLAALQQQIETVGAEHLAAILVEPVWAAGGTYSAPREYWAGVQQLCQRYELLLIADEVVTAWGRCEGWWHSLQIGLQPDMLCFAKGITSGYVPLGGVAFSPTISELIQHAPPQQAWWHALTYSAHPVACAVAIANLQLLESEQLLPRVQHLAEHLQRELATHLAQQPFVREIRQAGFLAGIECEPLINPASKLPDAAWTGQALLYQLRQAGIITRTRGSTVQFAPPYITSETELSDLVQRIAISLRSMYQTSQHVVS